MAFLRPTLKDVAQLSGVSEISVSRVMRNAPNISSSLRARVEAAALELHYTPNKVAGALATNTTDLVGVMVPTLEHIEYTKILSSVESVLGESKYRMMLGVSGFSPKKETKIIRDFLAWSPSGVIRVGAKHSDVTDELLERSKALCVDVLNDGADSEDCSFGVSYDQAAKDLVSHWINQCVKNIAYVCANERKSSPNRFKSALSKQLKSVESVSLQSIQLDEASTITLGMKTYSDIVQQKPDIDAIFFEHAELAVGASFYGSIKQSNSIALASFNNSPHIIDSKAAIDLIDVPFEGIGVSAAKFFVNAGSAESQAKNMNVMTPATFVQSQYK